MKWTAQASPSEWEYAILTLPLQARPDWATLGAAGWELAAVYPAALPPSPTGAVPVSPDTPGGFDGREFVFKRPKA